MGERRVSKVQEFITNSPEVLCTAFSPRSPSLLATGGSDHRIDVWRLSGTHHTLASLTGPTAPVTAVGFNPSQPDGGSVDYVVGGCQAGVLRVWDVHRQQETRKYSTGCHKAQVTAVDYHPFGDFFVSCSKDGNVKVWDLRKKNCLQTYKHQEGKDAGNPVVETVRFSPDGRMVASGNADGTVILWNLTAGKKEQTIRWHKQPVTSIDFHPQDFILATGSEDGVVSYWSLDSWEKLSSTAPTPSGVRRIRFSGEGSALLAANDNGLDVWGWGDIPHHDKVQHSWGNVGAMACYQNKMELYTASFLKSFVSIYVVRLGLLVPFRSGSSVPASAPPVIPPPHSVPPAAPAVPTPAPSVVPTVSAPPAPSIHASVPPLAAPVADVEKFVKQPAPFQPYQKPPQPEAPEATPPRPTPTVHSSSPWPPSQAASAQKSFPSSPSDPIPTTQPAVPKETYGRRGNTPPNQSQTPLYHNREFAGPVDRRQSMDGWNTPSLQSSPSTPAAVGPAPRRASEVVPSSPAVPNTPTTPVTPARPRSQHTAPVASSPITYDIRARPKSSPLPTPTSDREAAERAHDEGFAARQILTARVTHLRVIRSLWQTDPRAAVEHLLSAAPLDPGLAIDFLGLLGQMKMKRCLNLDLCCLLSGLVRDLLMERYETYVVVAVRAARTMYTMVGNPMNRALRQPPGKEDDAARRAKFAQCAEV
eukprot:Sspe_Gene.90498::Locus_62029_Transcript_1_1_Confidence_1.000_Length_2193::g.90498::m.90498/K18643/KATNB1; katanin p80 WD40 repeat-containing subunit B1